jgi:hypothetical protein
LLAVVALIVGRSGIYLLMSGKSKALEAEEELFLNADTCSTFDDWCFGMIAWVR